MTVLIKVSSNSVMWKNTSSSVWWQIKLCELLYNKCHIWALYGFRGCFAAKRYTNPRLLHFTSAQPSRILRVDSHGASWLFDYCALEASFLTYLFILPMMHTPSYQWSSSFYFPPECHRQWTGTRCAYSGRDGQAELIWVAGYILR